MRTRLSIALGLGASLTKGNQCRAAAKVENVKMGGDSIFCKTCSGLLKVFKINSEQANSENRR